MRSTRIKDMKLESEHNRVKPKHRLPQVPAKSPSVPKSGRSCKLNASLSLVDTSLSCPRGVLSVLSYCCKAKGNSFLTVKSKEDFE